MARKSFSDLLALVSGRFTPPKLRPLDTAVLEPKIRMVSDQDRRNLLKKAAGTEVDQRPTGMNFAEYLKATAQGTANERVENDRIRKMAPEISQAASILIPSILSPNDMKGAALSFTVNVPALSADQNAKIAKVVGEFFENEMDLSTALPRWTDEAMYRSGAKPLMLIPLSSLDDQFVDVNLLNGSVEAYHAYVKKTDAVSLYGFSDPLPGQGDQGLREIDQVMASVESFAGSVLHQEFGEEASLIKSKSYNSGIEHKKHIKDKGAYRGFIESVISTEALTVTDNPHTIQASSRKNNNAKGKIGTKAKATFRPADVITLHAPTAKDKPIGNPVFMELPTESVIPLYTPGTPNDHIGYFVLLDDRGHPLNIADYDQTGIHGTPDLPNQNNFTQLFQAYGYSNSPVGDQRKQDAVSSVYQMVVESHLKQRAEKAGFADVGLGSNASVFRYMFSRYLQQRKTKVLFVPKDMLTYFCFKHDENGVGVSKLDDVKFILSLRITLMTCRMLAAFNGAIDRRRIDIQFDQNFAGDVLEHMQTVQREAIRKSAVTFTHDPMNVAQQVANKSFTVKAAGIPGMPEFNVTNEANDKTSAGIDEQLAEDLKNLLVLDLDVPAAAMNNLSDTEYSRSVATTNLMFSRKLVGYQKIVKSHVDDLVQNYITFSSELSQKILGIARDDSKNKLTDTRGDLSDNKEARTNITLDDIITHIHLYLPSPNMAPDTAQFETLEKLVASIDTMVQALIPEDAAGDDVELKNSLAAIRAVAKSDAIRKLIKNIGFDTLDLPTIDTFNSEDLIKLRQLLSNVAAGLKEQMQVTGPTDNNPLTGGFDDQSGDGFGGGSIPGGDPNADPTADANASSPPGTDTQSTPQF